MPNILNLKKDIKRLIDRVRNISKLHLIYIVFYSTTGIVALSFVFIVEKLSAALLGVAATYIGSNLISQIHARKNYKEDISALNFFLDDLENNPPKDDVTSIDRHYFALYQKIIQSRW